jgi:hypothetical protein
LRASETVFVRLAFQKTTLRINFLAETAAHPACVNLDIFRCAHETVGEVIQMLGYEVYALSIFAMTGKYASSGDESSENGDPLPLTATLGEVFEGAFASADGGDSTPPILFALPLGPAEVVDESELHHTLQIINYVQETARPGMDKREVKHGMWGLRHDAEQLFFVTDPSIRDGFQKTITLRNNDEEGKTIAFSVKMWDAFEGWQGLGFPNNWFQVSPLKGVLKHGERARVEIKLATRADGTLKLSLPGVERKHLSPEKDFTPKSWDAAKIFYFTGRHADLDFFVFPQTSRGTRYTGNRCMEVVIHSAGWELYSAQRSK